MRSETEIREAQIRETQVRETLRSWVLSKAKNGADGTADHGAPDHGAPNHGELTDSSPLFEERRLRSLHLPELLLLLERLRGEPIDVDDLRPGDFRDIDTLVRRFCGAGVAA